MEHRYLFENAVGQATIVALPDGSVEVRYAPWHEPPPRPHVVASVGDALLDLWLTGGELSHFKLSCTVLEKQVFPVCSLVYLSWWGHHSMLDLGGFADAILYVQRREMDGL
jgi:hypothetical protein